MKNLIPNSASLAVVAMLAFAGCGSDSSSNSVTPEPTRNLISNGSFELPAVADTSASASKPFNTYVGTSQLVTGWTVGNVDIVHRRLWTAAEGNQSVDLNSQSIGWIGTRVASKAGGAYTLKFSYGANPASALDSPELRSFRVVWNGNPVETLSVQRTAPIVWKTESIKLTAVGNDSLRIESLTAGSSAAAIDDVSLVGP